MPELKLISTLSIFTPPPYSLETTFLQFVRNSRSASIAERKEYSESLKMRLRSKAVSSALKIDSGLDLVPSTQAGPVKSIRPPDLK